jgi:hypothetical protein
MATEVALATAVLRRDTALVVVTYRAGRITHYIDYGDRNKALEATGLAREYGR